ncbi:MAG: ABC transporter ATP-binding protein [Anaerolineae bacterium]|nr:ABC transporter ATP-binding protein [Anaerolineae bacterium]
MSEAAHAVEMRGIVMRFPGVLANDHVDFDLRAGEIHALLGENGAGKSTLMNVLAGMYRPELGTIRVHGLPVELRSPRDAIARGIGMVHQHFMLVPSQTVTENILLGLDKPRFRMRLSHYEERMAKLAQDFGLHVDPCSKIWQLSVGEQQRVEILKMLYRGADILIMDEPTAVLAPQEIADLFCTLRGMAAEGKSIVFISHKLGEVMQIADRITVLRKGRVTAAGLRPNDTSPVEMAQLMVGRTVLFCVEKEPQPPGDVVLAVEDVSALNDKGLPALRRISFQVHAGEILGIAGVAGNGQRELAEVITGLRKCTTGRVLLRGQAISNQPARIAIERGVGHVPEDRREVGTAPNLSITDNLILKAYRKPPIAKGLSIDRAKAKKHTTDLKAQYEIIAPSVDTPVRFLSGGNLQRVILAREISEGPGLMIAMQPTRGLDVGAIEGVQHMLLELRRAGTAVLLVSEELDEIVSLSDRVAVIYEGQIVGEIPGDACNAQRDRIGLMMTGQYRDGAAQPGQQENGGRQRGGA